MSRPAFTAGFSIMAVNVLLAGQLFARLSETPGQESPGSQKKQEQREPGPVPVVPPVVGGSDAQVWTPMTRVQKLRLGVRRTVDPIAFAGTLLKAGVFHWADPDSEYGKGIPGYAKRVSISFADGATGKMLCTFVFPSLLHQDPRYFPMGTGSLGRRLGYTVTRVFRTRTDAGSGAFNWSRILASLGSGALSNAYYPVEDRGVALTFANAGWSLLTDGGINIFREFWPDVRKWRANRRANHPAKSAPGSSDDKRDNR